jgi:transcription elongation factor Elf1
MKTKKRAENVAQTVECLPADKSEALSSNPSATKNIIITLQCGDCGRCREK